MTTVLRMSDGKTEDQNAGSLLFVKVLIGRSLPTAWSAFRQTSLVRCLSINLLIHWITRRSFRQHSGIP